MKTTLTLTPIESTTLTKGQSKRASEFGATHVFTTGDIRDLPQYLKSQLDGWDYTKIGHTSFRSKTWGAKRA
jgi:hypothetical protein